MKLCVDDILLTLYETHPEKFIYEGQEFPGYKFYTLDSKGETDELYTTIFHSKTKPFHVIFPDDPQITEIISSAYFRGQIVEFENATFDGPYGFGTYVAGDYNPNAEESETVTYLSGTGDLNFFFNYRGKENYPIPPFEEVKYYRDCSLTKDLLDTVLERLECFGVRQSFINDFESFVTSSAISTDTDLGSLNGFLMFSENPQVPPNYDFVLENITSYTKNLLPLWNGKSSHLHIDFDSNDFDFAKRTYDGDGRYGLYEASRTVSEFAPAHPIVTGKQVLSV